MWPVALFTVQVSRPTVKGADMIADPIVVVVDDHPIVRHALRDLIDARTGMRVVGIAAAGSDVPREIARLRPALVVQEWDLDDHGGGRLCSAVKELPWPPRVLVYTGNPAPDAVVDALHAGADSYLHKSADVTEVVDAVEQTCAGARIWLPRRLSPTTAHDSFAAADPFVMTDREKQVLALLVQRYNNHEIAAELNLAYQTVKNYVSGVLRKVGVTSRNELSARGRGLSLA